MIYKHHDAVRATCLNSQLGVKYDPELRVLKTHNSKLQFKCGIESSTV